jgi:broad specificity phosphatase PhoE
MRDRLLWIVGLLVLVVSVDARAEQTIVFMRHGEKPSGGYGQLTCQGFNRALALHNVLAAKYGRPDYLYAPSPAAQVPDSAGSFYYVRPLATIEPTAVRLGMPVRTKYAYTDIATLQDALVTSSKANTTIFVAWEHLYLQKLVQNIMNKYGGRVVVPAWASTDYDSLYVVKVDYVGGNISARFQRDHEGLNGQPASCGF